MKKIERLQKYVEDGSIRKFETGGTTIREQQEEMFDEAFINAQKLTNPVQRQQMLNEIRQNQDLLNPSAIKLTTSYLPQTKITPDTSGLSFNNETGKVEGDIKITETEVNPQEYFNEADDPENKEPDIATLGKRHKSSANIPWGMIGNAAIATINAVDDAVMGDKNFSAGSQAADSTVDAIASTASQFGPWGLLAAGALKALNFASKAGGKNLQGFDVDINNFGYGNLGHKSSEASRIWGTKGLERKLKKRNEEANMAIAAADISQDQAYEQEARTNSVTNVLQQNQIALAGGIDTSLLGN